MEILSHKPSGSRKISQRRLNLLILLLLASALILGVIFFKSDVERYYFVAFLWIMTVLLLLWTGNRYLFNFLDRWLSWSSETSKRFFLQISLSALYSLLCINSTYYLFKLQTSEAPDFDQLVVLNVYGLLFIIPVLSINFGIYFMNKWKKAQLQSNMLREDNLRTQLETLKMQLDPHFLFNNLNVLSSLIELDPKTAQDFLDKFADVYRYVLRYKKEELVSVNIEVEFIRSYVFLLKKRFGKQFSVNISISDDLPEKVSIPPLTLQLLVENAVKHNKISEKRPLRIDIFIEDNSMLVVKNSLNLKESESTGLTKTGLENIRKRYEYLSESEVMIEEEENYFTVRLPLLEIQ